MQDLEQTNSQSAPQEAAAAAESAPAVTDLDGLSEFQFQGEKFTPDRLAQIYSEYKNLSEAQKSFADQKRFEENLEADLDNVLKNPQLAQRFKEVYPKKYHGIVDRLLKTNGQAVDQSSNAQPALPPEYVDKLSTIEQRLKFFEDRAFQAEVETASANIDKVTKPLFEKYPLAIEDQVFARAEAMVNGGLKVTDKVWERLIRESHDIVTKRTDQYNGAKLKEQIEKGRRAQDVGPGGAAPGQAPQRARTFAEAQEQMIQSLKGAR